MAFTLGCLFNHEETSRGEGNQRSECPKDPTGCLQIDSYGFPDCIPALTRPTTRQPSITNSDRTLFTSLRAARNWTGFWEVAAIQNIEAKAEWKRDPSQSSTESSGREKLKCATLYASFANCRSSREAAREKPCSFNERLFTVGISTRREPSARSDSCRSADDSI